MEERKSRLDSFVACQNGDIESIIYTYSFSIGVYIIVLMIGCCQEDGEKTTKFLDSYNYHEILKNWFDLMFLFLFESTWVRKKIDWVAFFHISLHHTNMVFFINGMRHLSFSFLLCVARRQK